MDLTLTYHLTLEFVVRNLREWLQTVQCPSKKKSGKSAVRPEYGMVRCSHYYKPLGTAYVSQTTLNSIAQALSKCSTTSHSLSKLMYVFVQKWLLSHQQVWNVWRRKCFLFHRWMFSFCLWLWQLSSVQPDLRHREAVNTKDMESSSSTW